MHRLRGWARPALGFWICLLCAVTAQASPAWLPGTLVLVTAAAGDSDSDSDSDRGSDSDSDQPPPVPPTATVQVDCAAGDTIAGALSHPATELTIEISGMCRENVIVRRDNVILRGSDPADDGIQGLGPGSRPLPHPLGVLNTFFITVENLKLTGGSIGIAVNNSFSVDVINCRLEGNAFAGALAGNSGLEIFDTAITGNGAAGGAGRGVVLSGGSFRCLDCTITDNPGGGARGRSVLASQAAEIILQDTALAGDERGIDVRGGSDVLVLGAASSIASTPRTSDGFGLAVQARGSRLRLFGTPLVGPIRIDSSQLELAGVGQTIPVAFSPNNLISMGSTLRLPDGSLAGNLDVAHFSKAVLQGSAAVQGDLICGLGGDAFCDPTVTVTGSSSCGQCPVP